MTKSPPPLPPSLSPGGERGPEPHASPGLGRALRIRSMVTMAGEVIPFVWPMRTFIHHNPLHGLEHLPFETAVAQASDRFHARGYLERGQYQELIRAGDIDPDIVESLIAELLLEWGLDAVPDPEDVEGLDLKHVLATLMTRMDQPSAGNAYPSTDAILAQLRPAAATT